MTLDNLNQGIIRALQTEPRTTNKELGERLGVSEATVAARIRSLEDQHVLRVMMQRDFRAMGYEVMAFVDINVAGRSPGDVAADLAHIEEAMSVSVTLSNPDVILQLSARDALHLQELIETEVAQVAGIARYDITTLLEVMKLDSRYGALESE